MTSLAFLGNLAGGDGLIIFVIILLLFGAKKLPELAKGLGSAVREFSKAKDEIHHEITRPSPPTQLPPAQHTQPYTAQTDDEYHREHQAADDAYHARTQTEEDVHRAVTPPATDVIIASHEAPKPVVAPVAPVVPAATHPTTPV